MAGKCKKGTTHPQVSSSSTVQEVECSPACCNQYHRQVQDCSKGVNTPATLAAPRRCAHMLFVLQNHVRIGHSIMMALAANPTPKLIRLPPSLISHQHSQALYLCQTMLQKCTSCSHQVTTMSHHMHGFVGQQHGFQYQSNLQLAVCSSDVACLAL